MDVFYAYSYGTAAWLSLQSVPLILTPKLIISLLSPEMHHSTPLEVHFARFSGFLLLFLASLNLLLTGSIPLTSSASAPISTDDYDPKAPYAVPTIQLGSFFHGLLAVFCYVRYVNEGQVGYTLGLLGYGTMVAVGLWSIMFGTEKGRISKRTGADKRTSGFPFRNVEADKKNPRKKFS